MSVEKNSPQRLRVERTPHTIVTNRIVQSVTNPDALAIWTYLQSKSANWKVVASYIQKHFGIGRDRYRKAMAMLVEMGLVSYVVDRDEKTGQLVGREIVVHCEPRVQETGPSGSPTVRKTDRSDNPTLGESTPYETERELHEIKPQENHEKPPSPPDGGVGEPDEVGEREEAFAIFWAAGMVKTGKKAAHAKFSKLAKKQTDPIAFAKSLADDIRERLAAGQLGFDKMHPTTYLNGERWEDDIVPGRDTRRAARPMHNLNSLDHEGDPMMAGDGRIAPEPRRTRG